ncbi:MAG: hypothetical protein OXI08_00185 [Cyanobacteria bacterium MAG IRC4_bin_6]|nr:hypothetical protein [Cyanobacteria bacterium MAG IRC3_bin_20]MDE0646497.1 hypothetical protein [Cyanobacteria bacterium MAG IRC4_bin_6]
MAVLSREDLQVHVRFRTTAEQAEQKQWEAMERQDNADDPQGVLA